MRGGGGGCWLFLLDLQGALDVWNTFWKRHNLPIEVLSFESVGSFKEKS